MQCFIHLITLYNKCSLFLNYLSFRLVPGDNNYDISIVSNILITKRLCLKTNCIMINIVPMNRAVTVADLSHHGGNGPTTGGDAVFYIYIYIIFK